VDDLARSVQATTTGDAAAVARGRRTAPNGVWAMLLFAATETALFGSLLGTYWYLESRSPQWPPNGIAAPSALLPLLLAGVLLLTTIPVLLAARAVRHGRRGTGWGLVALALVFQAGYLAWQIVLYLDDLARFKPDHTAYGSIYFLLLGADHAHVAVGLLLSLWVLLRLASGLTNYRVITVQAVAIYWVFVSAITAVVTLTQVSPS
jgi:heme/copper-type cytochrome/quinol oxidase subunit 3